MRLSRWAKATIAAWIGMAACYPTFSFRDVAEGGAGEGGAADGSSGEGGSGSVSGDGGPGDGASLTDAATAPLPGMVLLGVPDAAFHFRIEGVAGSGFSGLIDASAVLSHQFWMDETEVTAGAYDEFVDAGLPRPNTCATPPCTLDRRGPYEQQMLWHPDFDEQVGTEDTCGGVNDYSPTTAQTRKTHPSYPITCVSWYDAVAYCAFRGKRLPTLTEWMFAATNGGTNLEFPFTPEGNPVLDCKLLTYDIGGANSTGGGCHFPKDVKSTTMGPNGLYELAGSVFEWLYDWDRDYPAESRDRVASDFSADGLDDYRVRVGGAFVTAGSAQVLRNPYREVFAPHVRFNDHGFRCAKTVLTGP